MFEQKREWRVRLEGQVWLTLTTGKSHRHSLSIPGRWKQLLLWGPQQSWWSRAPRTMQRAVCTMCVLTESELWIYTHIHIYVHRHTYIYIYVYTFVYLPICLLFFNARFINKGHETQRIK